VECGTTIDDKLVRKEVIWRCFDTLFVDGEFECIRKVLLVVFR